MSQMPRFEREKDVRRKKHQRYLVNTAGAMGLAAGAARVPGAAKVIASRVPGAAKSKPLASMARHAGTWTPRSNALAGMGGAVGAASSLTWGRQLKSDIKREESKLGVSKALAPSERGHRRRSLTAAGVTGAGLATAGLGAVAGGVPKGKLDPSKPNIRGATGGGILGFRQAVHRRARNDIAREVADESGRWAQSQTEEFMRHRKKGKLGPERTIIRHMGRGQRLGRGAMYSGAAVAGLGALGVARSRRRNSYDRPRSPFEQGNVRKSGVSSVDPRDYQGRQERSGARLVGGGLGTAAAAGGVAGVLNRQGKRWKAYEQRSLKRAGELVPGLKGMKEPASGSDWHGVGQRLANQPQTEEGWSKVRAAGRHHGRATQANYFSGVYRRNAKVFGGVAAAGLGTAAYGAYKTRRNRPYGRAELRKRSYEQKADVVVQPRYGSGGVSGSRIVETSEVSKAGAAAAANYLRNKETRRLIGAQVGRSLRAGNYKQARRYRETGAQLRRIGKADSKDETGRKIGAITNTAGAIAGPAALYGAVKGRKEGGVPRGLTRDFGNSARARRAMPKTAARARKVAAYLDSPKSKPARVAAGVAGATAIGLQTANWAGDAIAARALSKKPPASVSKSAAQKARRKAAEAAERQAQWGQAIAQHNDTVRRATENAAKKPNNAIGARTSPRPAPKPDPVPDNVKLGGPTKPAPASASPSAFRQAPQVPRVAQPPLKGSTLSGGRKAALVAGGLGAAALVGAGAGRLRRRSKVEKAGEWRQHVSDSAIEAHDRTLPKYRAAKEQDMWANIATGGLGAGMAHRGAKHIMRGNRGAGAALAGVGALTAVAGASGARRNFRGARDIDERQRKIRARGYQRRAEAMEKLAKAAMVKPPKPPAALAPKKTPGMGQRSFVRRSSVRANPSGTMSTVRGTTR